MARNTKTVAPRKTTEVATHNKDALLQSIMSDAGAGFEEAGREAYAIPFLRVLQDLSPQVKKKMSGYIEGAKPGMFYNTVTQKLYENVTVVPCHFQQQFIEWIPRDKAAKKGLKTGFVAAHPTNSPLVTKVTREGAKNILPNGNELADTRNHFVLVLEDDGSVTQALISLTSTQLKVSRRWMSQMRAAVITIDNRIINAPSFAWQYRFGTEEESNDQGSWFAWSVLGRERVTDASVYAQAKAFHAMLRQGAVKVNYEDMDQPRGSGNDIPGDIDDDNEIDGA